jgi:hypothetical protein
MTLRFASSTNRGKPAQALAILLLIFGVGVLFGILPSPRNPPVPARDLLTAHDLLAWSVTPPTVARAVRAVPLIAAPAPRQHATRSPAAVVDAPSIALADLLPLETDAGQAPPLVASSAVDAMTPLPPAAEPGLPRRAVAGAVTAALGDAGAAMRLAFRKTGQSVKTAFAAIAP